MDDEEGKEKDAKTLTLELTSSWTTKLTEEKITDTTKNQLLEEMTKIYYVDIDDAKNCSLKYDKTWYTDSTSATNRGLRTFHFIPVKNGVEDKDKSFSYNVYDIVDLIVDYEIDQ